jgi:hypothetical protein
MSTVATLSRRHRKASGRCERRAHGVNWFRGKGRVLGAGIGSFAGERGQRATDHGTGLVNAEVTPVAIAFG